MSAVTSFQERNLGSLVLVPIQGNRMSPRLRHGIDAVYYAPSRFTADDLYVVDYGDGNPSVRYVQWMGSRQGFRLFGESPHYPDDFITKHELEQMMLGTVVCEIKVRDVERFKDALGWEGAA